MSVLVSGASSDGANSSAEGNLGVCVVEDVDLMGGLACQCGNRGTRAFERAAATSCLRHEKQIFCDDCMASSRSRGASYSLHSFIARFGIPSAGVGV